MQNAKWVFEPSHFKIGFSVRYFGISETEGFFHKFEGTITNEMDDFSDAQIDFIIDVNSIDTQDEGRDTHLKSADFFNAEKYPVISFKSSWIELAGQALYKMHGDLTMIGISRLVILDVEFGDIMEKDPFGKTKAGFSVETRINRKDWNMTWNRSLDFGGIAVGELVKIKCNIELQKITE